MRSSDEKRRMFCKCRITGSVCDFCGRLGPLSRLIVMLRQHRPDSFAMTRTALLLFVLFFAPYAIGQTTVLGEAGGFVVQNNVMVRMRDGVQLATDIYFPASNGTPIARKFPVVLVRTPYSKSGEDSEEAPFYATHGYIYVVQDTRGRFESEGVWHMMTDDLLDGNDTAAWIVKQPWSDGAIATMGNSYVGGTQHALALTNPPGLKAMVPVDALSDCGYFGMRNGGAFELRFMKWIFDNSSKGSRETRDPGTRQVLSEAATNIREYLQNLPLGKGMSAIRLAPEYEDWLVFAMAHGENDSYWKQPGLDVVDQVDDYKDVPVYLVGGWYDSWALQTTMNYQALSTHKRGPVQLIMGPWIHGQQGSSGHGEVDFGRAAAIDMSSFRLRWFDRWLKDTANHAENEAPVKIFVMGGGVESKMADGRHLHGGAWRDENEWPLARTRFTPFYFHADGKLSSEKPAEAVSWTSYDFDPREPVPTIGGNISSAEGIMLQGAWNQKCSDKVWNCKTSLPLSARRDVIVFMTPPLKGDVEVTGPIEVKLWASSSALDTDFTAKLIDVHPPTPDFPGGIDMNLEDGIIRARFRDSLEKQKLMRPGAIYEFTIRLYPTSNVFKTGHRIRLDISSSNFPRFDVNPNSGEPLNTSRRIVVATNTIYHDSAHPSHVILPIIPNGAAAVPGTNK